MSKRSIAVIFGGVSSEHDISLMSASTIIENLNSEKYILHLVGITRDGQSFLYRGKTQEICSGQWINGDVTPCIISSDRSHKGLLVLGQRHYEVVPIDCAIPALHGKNGEDGTIQGLFQMAGIPFVGCDCLSSAACMDKEVTHIMLDHAGVKTAKWQSLHRNAVSEERIVSIEERLGYPVFVKPANAGSSIGVSKVSDRNELKKALAHAFQHDSKAIVEEMLVGKEVECAVLGNNNAHASLPGEIEPCNEFYDFEAKYQVPDSKLLIPADLDADTTELLRRTAVKGYRAMGCSGLARVDFFVTNQNNIILNEINTLPGFTSISMYPKMWEKTGLPIGQLLDRLIQYALER